MEALSMGEGRLRALFAGGLVLTPELSLRAKLMGMCEPVALVDGVLEIGSRPGAGTTIVAEVPAG